MSKEGKITKEELHPNTLVASNIKISDSNNHYTSSDVEGALNELFTNVDNGKSSIAQAIIAKGISGASKDNSFSELSNKIREIKVASGNAQQSDVLSGKTFTNSSGNVLTGTIPNRGGSQIITPSTDNQIISNGYYSGDITINGDPNLRSENIKSNVSIFGISGSLDESTKCTSGKTDGYYYLKPFDMHIGGQYDRFESDGSLRIEIYSDKNRKLKTNTLGIEGPMYCKLEGSRYSTTTINLRSSKDDSVLFTKSTSQNEPIEFDINVKKDSYFELIVGKHSYSDTDAFLAINITIKYKVI